MESTKPPYKGKNKPVKSNRTARQAIQQSRWKAPIPKWQPKTAIIVWDKKGEKKDDEEILLRKKTLRCCFGDAATRPRRLKKKKHSGQKTRADRLWRRWGRVLNNFASSTFMDALLLSWTVFNWHGAVFPLVATLQRGLSLTETTTAEKCFEPQTLMAKRHQKTLWERVTSWPRKTPGNTHKGVIPSASKLGGPISVCMGKSTRQAQGYSWPSQNLPKLAHKLPPPLLKLK